MGKLAAVLRGMAANSHNRLISELVGCGAKRSRTADLLSAIQALYQLSYSPVEF